MRYELLKKIRRGIEQKIHKFDPRPVLHEHDFSWASELEASYPLIRKEAELVLNRLNEVINFDRILPGQRVLNQKDQWKSFFILGLGNEIPEHAKICPHTVEILEKVPGLINAFFSIHTPGLHIPPHRGPYAGILRYHMGLIIPEGDVAIKVDGEVYHWQEGKSLFFDDSFEHEAWNNTDKNRVILFVDFERPLSFPLSLINRAILFAFKHSQAAKTAHKLVLENQLRSYRLV